MFSKYEEISKFIRNHIENALTKSGFNPKEFYNEVKQTYGVSLMEADLVNLQGAIETARKTRNAYELGVKNSARAVTDWTNALEKAKDQVAQREGSARDFSYTLATKICIMLYRGPLTLDTMKELERNGYDGTYGTTTMMQMYNLYTEKERLERSNSQQKATIQQQSEQLNSFNQKYREQYLEMQRLKTDNGDLRAHNEDLKKEHTELKETITEQGQAIVGLTLQVTELSRSLPAKIMEVMTKIFHGNIIEQPEEENNKAMRQ